MTFMRPEALVLVPVVLAVLLWARHRARRRPRPIATWMLFARALGAMPPPPTKRRPVLRDLLLIVPALCVAVALARPTVGIDQGASVVIVRDVSLSMGTQLRGATRGQRGLEMARAMAVESADLVSVDGDATALTARAHAMHETGATVVVVSDRALPALDPAIGFAGVAGGESNVGITAAGIGDDGALLVRAMGTRVAEPVTVSITGQEAITLAPDALPWRQVIAAAVSADTGRVEIRLEMAGDGNPRDDVVILERKRARTTIGFPVVGHDALYRGFAANPAADVFRGAGACDVRIGEGEGVHRLYVGAERSGDPRPVAGTLICRDSTLTADLALESLHEAAVTGARVEVLASVGSATLVARDGSDFYLLQDPDDSMWKDHPSFPLLCAELLGWLPDATATGFVAADPGVAAEDEVIGPFLQAEIRRPPEEAAAMAKGTPLGSYFYGLGALVLAWLAWRRRL